MLKNNVFDQIQMRVVKTAANGVVGADTIFDFSQSEEVVTAIYRGGRITIGYLVGTVTEDSLTFRYIQLESSGKLDGGSSSCDIEILEDGRIRLIEHFQWDSRDGSGTNVFEQI